MWLASVYSSEWLEPKTLGSFPTFVWIKSIAIPSSATYELIKLFLAARFIVFNYITEKISSVSIIAGISCNIRNNYRQSLQHAYACEGEHTVEPGLDCDCA